MINNLFKYFNDDAHAFAKNTLYIISDNSKIIAGTLTNNEIFNDDNFVFEDKKANLVHFSKKYNVDHIFIIEKVFLHGLLLNVLNQNLQKQLRYIKETIYGNAVSINTSIEANVIKFSPRETNNDINMPILDYIICSQIFKKKFTIYFYNEKSVINSEFLKLEIENNEILNIENQKFEFIHNILLRNWKLESKEIFNKINENLKCKNIILFANSNTWNTLHDNKDIKNLIKSKSIIIETDFFTKLILKIKLLFKK